MDSLISAPPYGLSRLDATRLLRIARRFQERPFEMKTVLRVGRLDLSPDENEALLRIGARDLITELDEVLAGKDSFIVKTRHVEAVLVAILETLREEEGSLGQSLQGLRKSCDAPVIERH